MDRKNYIDIDNLREVTIDLGGGAVRRGNGIGFEVGDRITITEKFDGSNFSASWDMDTRQLRAFSRRQELNFNNTLNGAYNYVLGLDENIFRYNFNYIVFGEWSGARNKLIYRPEAKGKWYIFDIWDKEEEKWLNPDIVEGFCEYWDLEYVHKLYDGPFISWDHCRTFMKSPAYGDKQEGIVVRNVDKYGTDNSRVPFILKIVNDDFRESMVKAPKEIDPEKEAAKVRAQQLGEQICTENRVMKCLYKLQEDQIVPWELTPKDMGVIAKNLPKMVFDDCLKEEKEVVFAMGEYAGKTINGIVMKIIREKVVS